MATARRLGAKARILLLLIIGLTFFLPLISVMGQEAQQADDSLGPDIIVGHLGDPQDSNVIIRHGQVGDIIAFSQGTTACNITVDPNPENPDPANYVDWVGATSSHPVIAQNLYRLHDGTFEQIGMSWVKHGFMVFAESFCSGHGGCTDTPVTQSLAPGCSDTYAAALNGRQQLLGPRYQINPFTGEFPYPPPDLPEFDPEIGRLLQVNVDDLNPVLNEGASYFAEAIYISADDAAAGNQYNNASYRLVDVSEHPEGVYRLQFNDEAKTRQEQPAIIAWAESDSDVNIFHVDVPSDGRLWVGWKVIPVLTSTPDSDRWSYEYAIQNYNSDRAVQSVEVPVADSIIVDQVGFHDIDSHSGSPYDTRDWPFTRGKSSLIWETDSFSINPMANALRWGSLYNFRFEADAPPILVEAKLWLFRPGSPDFVPVMLPVPADSIKLLSSTPPSGAIDARQPGNLEGTQRFGWQEIEMTFNILAMGVREADFQVSYVESANTTEETPLTGEKPAITAHGAFKECDTTSGFRKHGIESPTRSMAAQAQTMPPVQISYDATATPETTVTPTSFVLGKIQGPHVVRLILDEPIPPAAWTVIHHLPSDTEIRLGYLPGDVNEDRTSTPHDILAVIDALNGVGEPRPIWSLDVDRSGKAGPTDILRVIDLLSGAESFDAYYGVSLP